MELKRYIEELEHSIDFFKKFDKGEINADNYSPQIIVSFLATSSFIKVIKLITEGDEIALDEYKKILTDYLIPYIQEVVARENCTAYYSQDSDSDRVYILNENDYVIAYISLFEGNICLLALPDSYEYQLAYEDTLETEKDLYDIRSEVYQESDYRNKESKIEQITGFLSRSNSSKLINEKIKKIDEKINENRQDAEIFIKALEDLKDVYIDELKQQNNIAILINREFRFAIKRLKNIEIDDLESIIEINKNVKEEYYKEEY